jgi:hypothetical protein
MNPLMSAGNCLFIWRRCGVFHVNLTAQKDLKVGLWPIPTPRELNDLSNFWERSVEWTLELRKKTNVQCIGNRLVSTILHSNNWCLKIQSNSEQAPVPGHKIGPMVLLRALKGKLARQRM